MEFAWILPVICIIGLIIARKYDKSFINPIVAFNALWIIVYILLELSIKTGFDKPTNEVILIIIVGCLGFNVVGLLFAASKKRFRFTIKHKSDNYYDNSSFEVRTTLINIFIGIVLIYSIITYADIIIRLIRGISTFSDIRVEYFTNVKDFMEGYIISPIRYAIIVTVILNVLNRKIKKTQLILTIIIVVLGAISSGGRLILINTVLMIIGAVGIYTIHHKLNIKQKRVILVSLILILSVSILITNFRTNTLLTQGYTKLLDRLLKTFVSYFSGGIIYFGKLLELHPIKSTTGGLNFIWGFLDVFFYFFAALGVFPYPQNIAVVGKYSNTLLNIGNNTYFNAFYTAFGYFYIDFGYVGVFLETALFAFIIINAFSNAVKSNKMNDLYSSYYLLLFTILCDFSTRWFMYDSAYALAFIVIRLCYKRVYVNTNIESIHEKII